MATISQTTRDNYVKNNSPAIASLYNLIKFAQTETEKRVAERLLALLKTDETWLNSADDKTRQTNHYKSNKVIYNRIPTYNDVVGGTAWQRMESGERLIMTQIAQIITTVHGYIQISNADLAHIAGIGVNRIPKIINELIEKQYLAYAVPRTSNKILPIYMVNPLVVGTGKVEEKRNNIRLFWQYVKKNTKSQKSIVQIQDDWLKSLGTPDIIATKAEQGEYYYSSAAPNDNHDSVYDIVHHDNRLRAEIIGAVKAKDDADPEKTIDEQLEDTSRKVAERNRIEAEIEAEIETEMNKIEAEENPEDVNPWAEAAEKEKDK